MSFDLVARNKKLDILSFNSFTWAVILDSGVGLVIGTALARRPGTFSYIEDKKGRCPQHNDGYYVTAIEARAMALVAKGWAITKKYINREWENMSLECRKEFGAINKEGPLLRTPVGESMIAKMEAFSEWAEKSHGFWIW
jgi:hypothetical protein